MVPVLTSAARVARSFSRCVRACSRSVVEIGVALAIVAVASALAPAAHAERIKDIATVAGVRGNQLVGYGLVVGLDGTGDQTSQTPFTIQAIKNMLAQLGVLVPANVNPQLRNVAAVTVQATLPPFSKPGQMIDITVSSIGNAQSLRGGSLLMTPLRGADGQIYALAQGNLIVGGFGIEGDDGSRVSRTPSTGRIPNGAIESGAVDARHDGLARAEPEHA
jgi:flagellar P-ring protein precursor FlgI